MQLETESSLLILIYIPAFIHILVVHSLYISLPYSLALTNVLLVVGEQFTEEAYIEADVIGFDGSIDEKPSEKPSLKRKSMDETDHYRYDVRKEQIHSSQQYGSSSLNSRGDVKRQIPEQTRSSQQYGSSSQNSKGDVNRQIPKNQEIQKAGGEQKVEKKEAFVEDKFGLVRVGNKRLVNIDSLILPQEKKHGGRSRLFVANLASGVTENDLKELFEQFGDVSEVFVNKEKGFGFVRLVSIFSFLYLMQYTNSYLLLCKAF